MEEIRQKALVVSGEFLLKNPEVDLHAIQKKEQAEKTQTHNCRINTDADSVTV